jgi:hypothetical protein
MTVYSNSPIAGLVSPPWWFSLAFVVVAVATLLLVVRALHQRDWQLTLAEQREMQIILGMVSAMLLVMLVGRQLGLGAVLAGGVGIGLGGGAVIGCQSRPVAAWIGSVCPDAARVRVVAWAAIFTTAYASALVEPRASVGVPAGLIAIISMVLAITTESQRRGRFPVETTPQRTNEQCHTDSKK